MSFVESHLLTLVIFLPVLGAALIALLPRGEGGQHKGIAFLFSLLTFLISIPLWTGFRAGPGRYAFEQKTEWAPALGFTYHVGLDGVALLLFLLTTFLGPLLMLLAIFWLWSNAGRKSFDYVDLLNGGLVDPSTQNWLFLAFALAFAIKVPVWPLHTWLPDAHTEAPAAGSIILAGVMLKMGTFGFIRYAMPLFPQAALAYAPDIAVLGVIGIVYGSFLS